MRAVWSKGSRREVALAHALRSNPGAATLAMTKYPQLLTNAEGLHQALTPQPQAAQSPIGIDKKTGQAFYQAADGTITAKPIEGATPEPGPEKNAQLIQTPTGYATVKNGQATPVTWARSGEQAPGLNAAPGSTIPGVPGGAAGSEVQGKPREQRTPAPKSLTGSEESEIQGLTQVMPSIGLAMNNVKAAGAGGIGLINREIVQHGPSSWSGAQAQNYNNALTALDATLKNAMGGSTRLKLAYENALDLAPSLGENENTAREKLNQVDYMMRQNIATTMQQLQGQGKDTSSLLPVAQQYNAMPKYMAQVSKLRQQLQDNPSSLSNSDVEHLYAEEAFRPDGSFQLPASSGLALSREMSARNLWGVRDQIVQSHPELSYLPDQKDLQSMYPTQMATPGQNETKPQPAPLQPSQLLTQPAPAPQPAPATGDQTQQTGGNQAAATPPLGG